MVLFRPNPRGGPQTEKQQTHQRMWVGSLVEDARGRGKTGVMSNRSLATSIDMTRGGGVDALRYQTRMFDQANKAIRAAYSGKKQAKLKRRTTKKLPKRGPKKGM